MIIIGTTGAVTGEIATIWAYQKRGKKIWLSHVRVDDTQDVVQIVFGGVRD